MSCLQVSCVVHWEIPTLNFFSGFLGEQELNKKSKQVMIRSKFLLPELNLSRQSFGESTQSNISAN
jgi:hypothetical protein